MKLTKTVTFADAWQNIVKNKKLLLLLACQFPAVIWSIIFLCDKKIISDTALTTMSQGYSLGVIFLVSSIITGKYPKRK